MNNSLGKRSVRCKSPVRFLLVTAFSTVIAACGGGSGGSSGSSGAGGGNSAPALQLSDGQVIDAGSGVIRIPAGDSSGVANVVATLLRQGALPECQGRFNDVPIASTLIEACLADQPSCAVDFIPGSQEIAVYPPPLYAPVGLEYQLSVVGRNGSVTDPVNAVFCLDVSANLPPQPAVDTYQLIYPNVLQKGGVSYDERCDKLGNLDGVLANDDDDEHVTNNCLRAELLELPRFASNEFRSSFAADGSFRYEAFGDIPPPDSSGRNVDSFTYRVSDGINPPSAPVRVEIVFSGENAAPIAVDDSYDVQEDSIGNIFRVLDNDTDPDALPLSIRAINNGPGNGVANIRNGVLIDYQPVPDFSGTDQFVYTVVDSGGLTTTGSVSIIVAAVNDAPEANNDSISTPENTSVEIFVLGNDTDPEGNELSIAQIVAPANGVAVDNGNGAILYTPGPNFSGLDPFEYTISDGNGGVSTATVVVSVDFVNVSPSAVNDALTVEEDGSGLIDVLANDTDSDGDNLELLEVTEPQNGTVEIISATSVRYTPEKDFSGSDQFEYRVGDGTVEVVANVSVTVSSVNDIPVAVDDNIGTSENTAVTIDVLDNDTDVDNDTLQITDVSQPASGSVSIANSSVVYTPTTGFSGVDVFSYTIDDGKQGSAVARVSVQVSNVNVFPEAADDSVTLNENSSILIDVLSNDSDGDGDPLTLAIDAVPENGVVRVAGAQIEYVPSADFTGDDQFQYLVSDGQGGTAVATVRITVNNVNATPVAGNDSASTNENESVTIDVLANDSDTDEQDSLTIASVTSPLNGSATVVDGQIVYQPNGGYFGDDSFQYTVGDGNGATDSASVTVSVASVNSDPLAVNDSVTTSENTLTTIAVLANDSDPDGDSLTVELASQPSKGTATISDNQIIYNPTAGQSGPDAFTYRILDGNGGSDIGNVSINITQVNNPPVANNDSISTPENVAVNISVLVNDSDPDTGDVLSLAITTPASKGFADVLSNNVIRYTPDSGVSGADSFVYTLSDGNGASDTATVTVTVIEAVVVDSVAPVVTAPADVTAEATGATTEVEIGTATAEDDVDGVLTATADNTGPYPLGVTTVTWSATDVAGNIGTATQTVTVTEAVVVDSVAPVVTAPADVTAEATGATTEVEIGTATAEDDVDGVLTATADNTGPYPLGVTTVTWSATDIAGNTGSATQTVTVEDTTPPEVVAPADITVSSTATVADIGSAEATDLVDGEIVAIADITGPYPVGPTTVTWSATDASGNTGTATQIVTVTETDTVLAAVAPL